MEAEDSRSRVPLKWEGRDGVDEMERGDERWPLLGDALMTEPKLGAEEKGVEGCELAERETVDRKWA